MKGREPNGLTPPDRPMLAVTQGDPCGIGPEIILKALVDERATTAARLVVLGDENCLRSTAKELKLRWPFGLVTHSFAPEEKRGEKPILLDLQNVDPDLVPGQLSALAGRAAVESIERSVELALAGKVDGIVTAPIHKEALSLAGYSDPGHTEMLQRLSGAPRVGMLFWCGDFSVGLLTTHLSLSEAIRRIRATRVLDQLQFFDREWLKITGKRPRLAVAALNPHAGEGGRFGVEEQRHLIPAVEKARSQGLSVVGPISADSVFTKGKDGEFDIVLALYHDQATIPVKFGYGRRAVNVTLGLPFIRASVDHGTAMDIAGKGIASEKSLVQAISVGARLTYLRRLHESA